MYLIIYLYIYIYIYIYMFVYLYICIFTYLYMYIHFRNFEVRLVINLNMMRVIIHSENYWDSHQLS